MESLTNTFLIIILFLIIFGEIFSKTIRFTSLYSHVPRITIGIHKSWTQPYFFFLSRTTFGLINLKSVLSYCNQQMEAAPGRVPYAGVPGLCGLCCSCCQKQERESLLPGWFSGVCPKKQAKLHQSWEYCDYTLHPPYLKGNGHKKIVLSVNSFEDACEEPMFQKHVAQSNNNSLYVVS